jgi:hypothetical protein
LEGGTTKFVDVVLHSEIAHDSIFIAFRTALHRFKTIPTLYDYYPWSHKTLSRIHKNRTCALNVTKFTDSDCRLQANTGVPYGIKRTFEVGIPNFVMHYLFLITLYTEIETKTLPHLRISVFWRVGRRINVYWVYIHSLQSADKGPKILKIGICRLQLLFSKTNI